MDYIKRCSRDVTSRNVEHGPLASRDCCSAEFVYFMGVLPGLAPVADHAYGGRLYSKVILRCFDGVFENAPCSSQCHVPALTTIS